MVYTLLSFLFKMQVFHNCNVFGSRIIHILYTGYAKIKKNSGSERLTGLAHYMQQNGRTVSYRYCYNLIELLLDVASAHFHLLAHNHFMTPGVKCSVGTLYLSKTGNVHVV